MLSEHPHTTEALAFQCESVSIEATDNNQMPILACLCKPQAEIFLNSTCVYLAANTDRAWQGMRWQRACVSYAQCLQYLKT